MEGPGAGQVLPETQLPPKQSPSCVLITGPGGILRALPRKGPGTGHKGSIFPGELRGAWCRQLPGRTPYILPMATVMAVLGPRCLLPPHAVPCRGQTDAISAPPKSCWLDVASPSPRFICRNTAGSCVCLQGVAQTPAGLAALWGQSLSLGRAARRGLLLRPNRAGGAQLHPSSITALAALPPSTARGTSKVGDMGFPARGIPHGANPGFGSLQDVAPVQMHFAGADVLFPFSPCPCARH